MITNKGDPYRPTNVIKMSHDVSSLQVKATLMVRQTFKPGQ
ncbi:MAG: hypothetical protein QF682_08320 [Candidatus Thermoplasmatota archaeon]|nr:hypothetical protein [Candidatus Thermoplasmatota archaeon]